MYLQDVHGCDLKPIEINKKFPIDFNRLLARSHIPQQVQSQPKVHVWAGENYLLVILVALVFVLQKCVYTRCYGPVPKKQGGKEL